MREAHINTFLKLILSNRQRWCLPIFPLPASFSGITQQVSQKLWAAWLYILVNTKNNPGPVPTGGRPKYRTFAVRAVD